MNKPSVIVLGAGASGMVAAIAAARDGADVTIIEHMDRVGKKILSTGNGKCNLTNSNQDLSNYRSDNPEFSKTVFKEFDTFHTLKFFGDLGIHIKNKKGYIYPYSQQASAVLDVLRMEINRLCINVLCSTHISSIKKENNKFVLISFGKNYTCDNLIIACGSKAAPSTGSDGSGYQYAMSFGHKIIDVVPALVQLRSNQKFFKSVAGVRTDVDLTLNVDGKFVVSEKGELQLTAYGISGIPVFQISRFAAKALAKNKKVVVNINFLPEFKYDNLIKFLTNRLSNSNNKTFEESMVGLFNKKLSMMFIKESRISPDAKVSALSDKQIAFVAKIINNFPVEISSANPFENAQVCAGGIDTEQLNETTLESKLIKGLYFCGEIIDIDGACGGYNLQWAWSSGYVAGKNASIKHPVFSIQ